MVAVLSFGVLKESFTTLPLFCIFSRLLIVVTMSVDDKSY